jgi:acyl-CoA oxidase-like protein
VLSAIAKGRGAHFLRAPSPLAKYDPRDPAANAALLGWRARTLMLGIAKRLQAAIKSGTKPFEAWNVEQHRIAVAGRAFAESLLVGGFVAEVRRFKGPASAGAALCDLASLSGLYILDASMAFFLRSGRLSAADAVAVEEALDGLCDSVAEGALALVAAFELPEDLIGSPLGNVGAALPTVYRFCECDITPSLASAWRCSGCAKHTLNVAVAFVGAPGSCRC